jgi:tRNA G10  N-methylase Trm11
MDALKSVDNLAQYIKHEIITNTFVTDILKGNALHNKGFCADIVITDVPYGNLARWTEETNNAIDMLLHTIIPVINMDTIIVIIHNKNQKINNQEYKKLRKYKVGHRLIEMMKLKNARR